MYRKTMSGILLGAGVLLTNVAQASNADWGYISVIIGTRGGAVLFNSSGGRTPRPGCQTPGLDARWALDGTTVSGQSQIAILLNAYNMHKKVTINGNHGCTVWPDTETVEFFTVQD